MEFLRKDIVKYFTQVALYSAIGFIGAVNLFSPVLQSGFNRFQPDLGDSYFNAFVLEHGFKAFWDAEYRFTFYSPGFFYPTKLVTTYSDNLLGAAPIYWIFRALFDWMTAFELWEITVSVFTYIAVILWLRYLGIRPVIAAITSYVFVFGISRIIQLPHPQLMPQFYTPLAFIFLTRFLKQPNIKDMNLFILFVFLQTVAGYYLGWFLIFSLCLLVIVLPVFLRRSFKNVLDFLYQHRFKALSWGLFWLIVFGLFWSPYIYTSLRYRDLWDWSVIRDNLASPYSYLLVPKTNMWYFFLQHLVIPIKPTFEQYLFGGMFLFGAVILSVLFFFRKIKKYKDADFTKGLTLSFIVVAFLTLVLSVRIYGYSLWYFIYQVFPGADGVRYVSRIWVIAYFYLFTAAAYMFNDIAKSYWKNNVFKGFYVFLIVFLVAEQLVIAKPFVSKASAIEPISSIKEVIHKNQCPVFYLETDATQELYIAQHIHAMWAGMDLNTPTVNGYTGISKYDLGKKLSKDEIKEMLYESPENPVCIIELNDTHAKLKEIY